jgi:Bifunctional DNA primase/polymerase, N-terminal
MGPNEQNHARQPASASAAVFDAALRYAADGLLIFPCNPLDKSPLTANGFKDASCDPQQILSWWERHPNATIGMPTGKVSGFWVLDADVDLVKNVNGLQTLSELIARHGELPTTRTSITPRGGRHLQFRWRDGLTLRNSAGNLGPGLDVRGEGGYIIAPPSMRADGVPYQWDETAGKEPADAPDWLIALASRQEKSSATRPKAARKSSKRDQAWARAALDAECAKISSAPPGTRNAALNLGAYNVFQIVWGNPGALDEQEVRHRLFAAAEACGLVDDDGSDSVWRTITSGAEGAKTQPRVRPLAKLEQPASASAGAGGSLGLTRAAASTGATAGAAPAPGIRRVIQMVEGERHRIVDEAEDALIAAGGFDIYQRDAVMVRPVMHRLPAAPRHGIKRATVVWRLMRVKPLYLIEMLGRVAIFQSYDRRRRDWTDKDCPNVIGETLLAREGVWRVPVLLGVVHTPQLRVDGSLLTTPGYDPQTQLLFKPDGEVFPDVPEHPSKEDARLALETVKGSISTFPFTSEIDRAVALSLLLTGVCRRTLDFAPLHAITAPAPGTGKSLLVDLISVLLTGEPAPVISTEIDAAEFEKRFGASLMAGDPIISFDNCVRPLDHALLCQAVTQTRLSVRVLGFSENRNVTMSALLVMNGNNLVLQGDMPRRSVRCEMDAKVERPELRVFPTNIQAEFRRRRGELVVALLTILRAYQVSGEISAKPALGGFEMWSHWVRDALIWLGVADPCDSTEVIYAGNPDRQKHEALVLAWLDHFGIGTVVTVRELIEASAHSQFLLQQPSTSQRLYDALLAVAEDHRHRGSVSTDRLGRWLNKVSGKYEHGMRIVRAGIQHGYPRWQLSS